MNRLAQLSARHLPTVEELRAYKSESLRLDLQAGVTVAVFAIPQVMAYAMLAGVPPVHGLYAAVVMSVVASLFGSSPYVNTGPSNSAALLTAAAIAPFAGDERFLSIVFSFALLIGLIRLVMGLARLGRLVDFVPDSAFLGFTVGAGILIGVGQLHHLFGLEQSVDDTILAHFGMIAARWNQTNPYAFAIGLGAFAIMLIGGRISRRFPSALLALAIAAVAARLLGDAHSIALVQDIARVPSQLPPFSWPFEAVDLWPELFPAAFAVAVIGLVEAVSIGETLAIKHGQSLDYDREFVGQGLGQITAAFFQGIPGSGSFGRSTLIELAGGQTRLANVAFGLCIALALILMPGALNQIPIAALAGLLLFIAWKLVDIARLRRVWTTSRADTIVLLLTLITTLFVRIEYGILVGTAAGALIQLRNSSQLRLGELLPDGNGGFLEEPFVRGSRHLKSDIVAVAASGDLFYGVSHRLRDELNRIVHEQQPRHLILRVRRAHSIDYSCWSAIFDVAAALQIEGGKLYLCGVRPDYAAITELGHMRRVLPNEQVFPAENGLFRSFENCLSRVSEEFTNTTKIAESWKVFFENSQRNLPAPKCREGPGVA